MPAVVAALLAACAPDAARAGDATPSLASLANGCFTIAGAGEPLHFKPTGPGTYLLHDDAGRLLGVRAGALARLGGAEDAGPAAEWSVRRAGPRTFAVRATAGGRSLAAGLRGDLVLAGAGDGARRVALAAARGCRRFPEAEVGATGTSPPRRARGGPVVGFADTHLHLTADLRAGGRVIHGTAFHRFGIARALGDDARTHGADGALDVTGNLLREGLPFGTHDTLGWPTFTGWPVHDTNTHQQAYWVWLQRALKAGLRLVVAQTVEDDELCRLEPRRSHSCDETATIELVRAPPARAGGLRRRPARGRRARMVPDRHEPAPGAARDRARQARRGHRRRVLEPVRLRAARAAAPPARAPTSTPASPARSARACARCSSPTGSTTPSPARRSRAATRAGSSRR